jgi:hypothetical protein
LADVSTNSGALKPGFVETCTWYEVALVSGDHDRVGVREVTMPPSAGADGSGPGGAGVRKLQIALGALRTLPIDCEVTCQK